MVRVWSESFLLFQWLSEMSYQLNLMRMVQIVWGACSAPKCFALGEKYIDSKHSNLGNSEVVVFFFSFSNIETMFGKAFSSCTSFSYKIQTEGKSLESFLWRCCGKISF